MHDNNTGFVWEVKTDDGSQFDRDNGYRWGGLTAIGRDHPDRQGLYHDDWNALVNAANNFNSGAGLCGFTDWRLPNLKELYSLLAFDRSPMLNQTIFPGEAQPTWTSTIIS